jgi:hypothetical protein
VPNAGMAIRRSRKKVEVVMGANQTRPFTNVKRMLRGRKNPVETNAVGKAGNKNA